VEEEALGLRHRPLARVGDRDLSVDDVHVVAGLVADEVAELLDLEPPVAPRLHAEARGRRVLLEGIATTLRALRAAVERVVDLRDGRAGLRVLPGPETRERAR